MKIRKAKIGDVREIHKLLNFFAERRELLPRSLSEIYENLQQFYVAVDGNKVIGCSSLYVTWENLAEIKGLAVAPEYQGKGLGKKLLQANLAEAKELGVKRIFTLTIRDGFFNHFGFKHVPKEMLPHKVWTECARCPYFPEKCIETALYLDLTPGAPTPKSKQPSQTKLPEAVIIPSEPASLG